MGWSRAVVGRIDRRPGIRPHALIARERSTIAATRFLEHVLAPLSYRVEAVMTDNDMMFTIRMPFIRIA